MRGRFCLSDDSHGVEQLALNYHECIPYLKRNHISCVHFLEALREKVDDPIDSRFPCTNLRSLTVAELGKLPFWHRRNMARNPSSFDNPSQHQEERDSTLLPLPATTAANVTLSR